MLYVIVFCVVDNTVGNYDNVTGLNVIKLVINEIGAVAFLKKIYFIKGVVMRPGYALFGNSFIHTPMAIKFFSRVKSDMNHIFSPSFFFDNIIPYQKSQENHINISKLLRKTKQNRYIILLYRI